VHEQAESRVKLALARGCGIGLNGSVWGNHEKRLARAKFKLLMKWHLGLFDLPPATVFSGGPSKVVECLIGPEVDSVFQRCIAVVSELTWRDLDRLVCGARRREEDDRNERKDTAIHQVLRTAQPRRLTDRR
jgi:hypothetical protein